MRPVAALLWLSAACGCSQAPVDPPIDTDTPETDVTVIDTSPGTPDTDTAVETEDSDTDLVPMELLHVPPYVLPSDGCGICLLTSSGELRCSTNPDCPSDPFGASLDYQWVAAGLPLDGRFRAAAFPVISPPALYVVDAAGEPNLWVAQFPPDPPLIGWFDDGLGEAYEGLSIAAISVGPVPNCALDPFGRARCVSIWGWGLVAPRPDPPSRRYRQVATYGAEACAIRGDRTMLCWGALDAFAPLALRGPQRFRDVSVEYSLACAITVEGNIECLDHPDAASNPVVPGVTRLGPTPLDIADAQRISVGPYAACVLRENGAVRCWGRTDVVPWMTMEVAPQTPEVVSITTDSGWVCTVLADESVTCWGRVPDWLEPGMNTPLP